MSQEDINGLFHGNSFDFLISMLVSRFKPVSVYSNTFLKTFISFQESSKLKKNLSIKIRTNLTLY